MHKTGCIIILQALVMTPVVYMWRSLDDYEGHYKSTYEELDNDQIIINWNCVMTSLWMKNKFYWNELQVKHNYTIYKVRIHYCFRSCNLIWLNEWVHYILGWVLLFKDHLEILCDFKNVLTLAKNSESHQ